MVLARKGFYCTGEDPLYRNVFKDIECLPSQVTEISNPSHVETAHFEGGETDIRTRSTSSWQQTAES